MEFPEEMHDMFQKIAEHHNAQFRLCKTLFAGFKATNEQDLRICSNMLALKVKLNDLRSNMDIRRIAEPTEKDMDRLERYKAEYAKLMKSLDNMVHFDISSCDVKLDKHKNGKLDYEL